MKERVKNIIGFGLLIILIGTLILSCDTEGSVDPAYKDHYIKYYGGDGSQIAKDFVVNSDGTVVMVGTSAEMGNVRRIYLVKANAEGEVIWSKKLGTDRESVRDIDVFKDGGDGTYKGHYMILSNCKRLDSDSTDIKVLVVDHSGTAVDSVIYTEFSTEFGSNNYFLPTYGYSLTALSDGGFIVTGNIDSTAHAGDNSNDNFIDVKDRLAIRYKDNLDYDDGWFETFGGEGYAMGVKILESGNSSFPFYYAGYSDAMNGGDVLPDMNFLFVRMTESGGAQNLGLTVGGSRGVSETMSGIAKSSNGLYLAVGSHIDGADRKIYGSVINSTFENAVREGIVDGSTPQNADGISVAASQTPGVFWVLANATKTGGRDIWVGKVNSGLTAEISFTFGGPNNDDTGSAIQELPNGDLLILATMELVNQKKMALIKVRPNGRFK